MYCRYCDDHYPKYLMHLVYVGMHITAQVCPLGHKTGICTRGAIKQRQEWLKAGNDQKCRDCIDRLICIATFQQDRKDVIALA